MTWRWLLFLTNLISKFLMACGKKLFLRWVVFALMLECLPEGTHVFCGDEIHSCCTSCICAVCDREKAFYQWRHQVDRHHGPISQCSVSMTTLITDLLPADVCNNRVSKHERVFYPNNRRRSSSGMFHHDSLHHETKDTSAFLSERERDKASDVGHK